MLEILFPIEKADEMNTVPFGQIPDLVKRADLIPFVRGIGNPVDKVENFQRELDISFSYRWAVTLKDLQKRF